MTNGWPREALRQGLSPRPLAHAARAALMVSEGLVMGYANVPEHMASHLPIWSTSRTGA